jgi:hypothetical protein
MSARDILARALPISVGTVGTVGTAAETLAFQCSDLPNPKSEQSEHDLPEHRDLPWADDQAELHNWLGVPTCSDPVPTPVGTPEAAQVLTVPTAPTCSDRKWQGTRFDAELRIIAEDLLAEGLTLKPITATMRLEPATVRALMAGGTLRWPGIGRAAEVPPSMVCACGDAVHWRRWPDQPWRCRTCRRPNAYDQVEWLVGGRIQQGRGYSRPDEQVHVWRLMIQESDQTRRPKPAPEKSERPPDSSELF